VDAASKQIYHDSNVSHHGVSSFNPLDDRIDTSFEWCHDFDWEPTVFLQPDYSHDVRFGQQTGLDLSGSSVPSLKPPSLSSSMFSTPGNVSPPSIQSLETQDASHFKYLPAANQPDSVEHYMHVVDASKSYANVPLTPLDLAQNTHNSVYPPCATTSLQRPCAPSTFQQLAADAIGVTNWLASVPIHSGDIGAVSISTPTFHYDTFTHTASWGSPVESLKFMSNSRTTRRKPVRQVKVFEPITKATARYSRLFDTPEQLTLKQTAKRRKMTPGDFCVVPSLTNRNSGLGPYCDEGADSYLNSGDVSQLEADHSAEADNQARSCGRCIIMKKAVSTSCMQSFILANVSSVINRRMANLAKAVARPKRKASEGKPYLASSAYLTN
jgi:hypothetical protein